MKCKLSTERTCDVSRKDCVDGRYGPSSSRTRLVEFKNEMGPSRQSELREILSSRHEVVLALHSANVPSAGSTYSGQVRRRHLRVSTPASWGPRPSCVIPFSWSTSPLVGDGAAHQVCRTEPKSSDDHVPSSEEHGVERELDSIETREQYRFSHVSRSELTSTCGSTCNSLCTQPFGLGDILKLTRH